jgi:hypothetical protein
MHGWTTRSYRVPLTIIKKREKKEEEKKKEIKQKR